VLDFSKAVHGPRLLDLAAWQGNAGPPDPDAIRTLIDQYVRAGGHRGALVDRGGLAPERWALGWRLVQDVEWALRCATIGVDDPATDEHLTALVRTSLTSAVDLLAAK
jgi:hypothetical protein